MVKRKQENPVPNPVSEPETDRKRAAKPGKAEKVIAETILIQTGGGEWELATLKEKIMASYVAQGHRRGRISSLTLYVKPEERKVYYVINGKTTGDIDFD